MWWQGNKIGWPFFILKFVLEFTFVVINFAKFLFTIKRHGDYS